MPTAKKLPSNSMGKGIRCDSVVTDGLWINLDNILDVGEEVEDEEPVVNIRMVGDADFEPSIHLVGPDREVFLKALSKFTMK